MMEETKVFLEYLLGLICGILLGIVFGGLWTLVGPIVLRNPLAMTHDSGGIDARQAIERALTAEEAFGSSWPMQDYVMQWWGWSAVSEPAAVTVEAEETPIARGDMITPLVRKASSGMGTKVGITLSPWFHLVWIRGVAALSILVAALLPTLALWLDGRRRAYAFLATGQMSSTGLWKIWGGITTMLAVVAGVLIGAPIPAATAPWLLIVMLGALLCLCQMRANKNARLS